jgi:CRP-like cAMP-binding protein
MVEPVLGETLILDLVGPGSFLGLPAVLGREPHTLTAVAQTNSVARFLPGSELDQLIRAVPSLQLMVLEILASEVHRAHQALSGAY